MISEVTYPGDAAMIDAFATASAADGAIALLGPAGSGKTTALLARLQRDASTLSAAESALLLTPASPAPLLHAMQERYTPAERARVTTGTFFEFAEYCFQAHWQRLGFAKPPQILSDQAALLRLLEVADSLTELRWPEIQSGAIDPEVSGIRSPERFLQTTYRFFERLRGAAIEPVHMAESAHRGTTMFYAAPPNFADAELIRATKETYRDSLRVDAASLDHQRRRESDLGAIVAKLAEIEADDAHATQRFSPYQALHALTTALTNDPVMVLELRAQFPLLYIDEAQDVGAAERAWIDAMYGPEWPHVVFAGNPDGSVRGLEGVRPKDTFAKARSAFTLEHRRRGNAVLWTLEEAIMAPLNGPKPPHASPAPQAPQPVLLARATDRAAEATSIAEHLRERISSGTSPHECAVLVRSLPCAWQFVEELLAADISVDIAGAVDPLWDRATADIHALFLSLTTRNRPAAFLRLAESPLLRLCDRSIALLCQAPGEPTLFAMDPQVRQKSSRDPERLAHSLLDGCNDTAFETETRVRIEHFRARHGDWRERLTRAPEVATLRDIIRESGLVQGPHATAALGRTMAARYLDALQTVWTATSEPSIEQLATALARYERTSSADAPRPAYPILNRHSVVIGTVEALRGHEFETVVIPDAKAGAFPRYYVPDSYVFSPTRGFIPRDNVGPTGAGRTAKFTWYLHAVNARAGYNREERRLFATAISRARSTIFLSAAGPPTRGVAAPEFLEEIRRAGLSGIREIRPSTPTARNHKHIL